MAATKSLVAVEAKAQPAAFLHLGLGKPFDGASLAVCRNRRGDRRWRRGRRWRSGQRQAPGGRPLRRTRWRRGRTGELISQLQLAGETHGHS
jgi:hypothetical protein